MTQEPSTSTDIDCADAEIQALIDSFMFAIIFKGSDPFSAPIRMWNRQNGRCGGS